MWLPEEEGGNPDSTFVFANCSMLLVNRGVETLGSPVFAEVFLQLRCGSAVCSLTGKLRASKRAQVWVGILWV